MNTTADFSGDQARNYARYRHGYPAQVVDVLVGAFTLVPSSVVLDLGCGTGQLTLPLAGVAGSVIGADPQPDMLSLARVSAIEQGTNGISWLLASDQDVPTLGRLLGRASLTAVTIGNAIHLMHPEILFGDLAPLIRPTGGIAVIANGSPIWLHDTTWARALRAHNEKWFGPVTSSCGTSGDERQGYRDALATAGFTNIDQTVISYDEQLTLDYIIGHLYSAITDSQITGADRVAYTNELRHLLLETEPSGSFTERVDVDILIGRR